MALHFGQPGLSRGVICAVLDISGILPEHMDFVHSTCNGSISEFMHFFNMTAGIPSGPGAAFAESALIASFRSSVVIGIVLILIASGSSVKKKNLLDL